jgi:hypothetical protein
LVIVAGVAAVAFLGVGLFNKFQGDKDTPLVLPGTADASAPTSVVAVVQPTQPPTKDPSPTLQVTDASAPAAPTITATTVVVEPTDTSATSTLTTAPTATTEELEFAPDRAWWVTEMKCNEQGECTPPDEVADEIIAVFWEWKKAIPAYIYELDMTQEQLEYYYTGEILRLQLEFVSLVKETGTMWDGEKIVQQFTYEIDTPYVASCTPDGLTCFLGETVQGNLTIYEYDLSTRQIVNVIENPPDQHGGVNIWLYQYDVENGRWKVERYYKWVPTPAP